MNCTAVIVDDEPCVRDVVKALGHWRELGITVVGEAEDGAAGLELAMQLKPDIVISDVKMPRMSGLELAAQLQNSPHPPKNIIVSGYDDYDLVRQALKCGVTDYLLKPIKESELNEQLAACAQAVSQHSKDSSTLSEWQTTLEGKPWLVRFRAFQHELGELLRSADKNVIRERFSALKAGIGDSAGLPETIYCYYSLVAVLQGFMQESGLDGSGKFSYVFGSRDGIDSVLSRVCEWFCEASDEANRRQRQRGRLDIGQVKQYISENYDKNLSLQSVADHFYVSREYLSRSFKAEYKESFSEYLLSCRMERAKQLLVEYNIPIKEVWRMLRFVDQTHFYKCFKRYFGMTPGEMRAVSRTDNKIGQT